MSRSLAFVSAAALVGALYSTACGGRSPLATNFLYDDPDLVAGNGGTGGSGGAGGAGGTGVGGAAGMAGSGGTAGAGGSGTAGSGGTLPTECLMCAGTECPEAVDCLMDSTCRDGLLCAFQTCMGGGGQPDIMCMLDCFDGDIGQAMQAGQAVYCIIQSCGEECGGMLPF